MSGESRRSDTQITLEILSAVRAGARKRTRIMYECNLSYRGLMTRIDELLEGGFIRAIKYGGKESYEITEKGREMIIHLKYLSNMLKL
ncbi:hypothetical protein GF319_00820 [Candidatus Bathyarchaeota archaeon]|nr:hypothetical protein [Candidatus Bathyarchaeota archaeon]